MDCNNIYYKRHMAYQCQASNLCFQDHQMEICPIRHTHYNNLHFYLFLKILYNHQDYYRLQLRFFCCLLEDI
nr:MAG TPA: hypothetical protein [Crassvirales sp.]